MSCMLQPPVPSLPPMAPALGSADHVSRVLAAGVKYCHWLPVASGRASPVTGATAAALETQEPHAGAYVLA